jgi:hypothetical protein
VLCSYDDLFCANARLILRSPLQHCDTQQIKKQPFDKWLCSCSTMHSASALLDLHSPMQHSETQQTWQFQREQEAVSALLLQPQTQALPLLSVHPEQPPPHPQLHWFSKQ